MSEYINYYICKKKKDTGVIYPLGPFDDKGRFICALWKSRSFYTDLPDLFTVVSKDQISDELIDSIFYSSKNKDDLKKDLCDGSYYSFHYCPIEELGSKDFIQSGYYLVDDIKRYELSLKGECEFDDFYECLSPTLYCQMLMSENSSKYIREYDCEDSKMKVKHASDYAYYMYPNYQSKEYEAFVLYTIADTLTSLHEDNEYDVVAVFYRG